MHLRARHAPASVDRRLDRALHRRVEARPAGAALEFGLALEQRLAAAGAGEYAGTLLVVESAAARPFGAVLAHHGILLGGQQGPPLGFGMGDGKTGFLRLSLDLAHEVLLADDCITAAGAGGSASSQRPASALHGNRPGSRRELRPGERGE